MPYVYKFISVASYVASLNLNFNDQVLDFKLDSIAQTGSEEAGYSTLGDIIREGDSAEGITDSHPAYKYKPYIKDLTLLDMPSGCLVIFKLCRIVIPSIMRSQMLSALHRFHMSEQAMVSAAASSCWWRISAPS